MRKLGLWLTLSIVLAASSAAQSATELKELFKKAYLAGEAGRYDEVVEICVPCFENESIDINARGACAWMLARIYSIQGQIEPAIEWYERCTQVGFSLAESIEIDPAFANLRRDPRFARHLEAVEADAKRRQQERTAAALASRCARAGQRAHPRFVDGLDGWPPEPGPPRAVYARRG